MFDTIHTPQPEPFPRDGLVRLDAVMRYTGLGRTTLLGGIKDGTIPITPIKLTQRCVGYPAEQVRAFVAQRIDAASTLNKAGKC